MTVPQTSSKASIFGTVKTVPYRGLHKLLDVTQYYGVLRKNAVSAVNDRPYIKASVPQGQALLVRRKMPPI